MTGEAIDFSNATLLDCLAHWASAQPEKMAVETRSDGALTYAQLHDRAERLAGGLRALGLKPGDRIAIQLPSYPDFLVAYYGVTRMGGILTTLHMPYRKEELRPLIDFAGAKAAICATVGKYDGPETMRSLCEEIDSLEHVIALGEAAQNGTASFEALCKAEPIRDPLPPPGAPCTMCFTSGTSAAPKGVVRDHATMAANARRYTPMIRMTAEDRVMIAPPFTHVFGLLCAGNAMLTGATVLPIPLFSPDSYVDVLCNASPTIIYSAPAHLAATLKSGVMDSDPPASVRDVIVGGSICPPEIARRFEDKLPNGRVGCLFGMTEVLLATQTDIDDPPPARHGSVGKLVPGLELRLVDETGSPVADHEEGELQLHGYSVLREYEKNPEANASSFTEDGWFRTGDLATLDDDGNIIITGRVKDLINRGGIKINPSDIESLIDSHEDVLQSAIVPMPDDVLGERICLYVTPKAGATPTLEAINDFLERNGVAKMRWPERLEIIDAMPMTPTRKIIKAELAARIRAEMAV